VNLQPDSLPTQSDPSTKQHGDLTGTPEAGLAVAQQASLDGKAKFMQPAGSANEPSL